MKQTFTRPDGTEVTVEGTPEELAKYERQINEGSPNPPSTKKKPVLKGSESSYEELAQWVKDHFEGEFQKLLKEIQALRQEQIFRTIFIERDPAPPRRPCLPFDPTAPFTPWDGRPQIWCTDNTLSLTDGKS